MRTDPEPVEGVAITDRRRSIRVVDASAPQPADRLQTESRMCRIFAEPIKLLVCCDLHVTPEAIVQIPEIHSKRANETSRCVAGRRSHRTEFSGADIAFHPFDHMRAAAARRKIPGHLPVPFIHGLNTKPCCQVPAYFSEPTEFASDANGATIASPFHFRTRGCARGRRPL